MRHHERPAEPGWRFRLHEIVFEADTRGGRLFDAEGHDVDAAFCKYCGESLAPGREPPRAVGTGDSSAAPR